jgi:hypothetical protein
LFTMYSEALRKTFNSVDHVDAVVDKAEGMVKLVECVERMLGASRQPPSGAWVTGRPHGTAASIRSLPETPPDPHGAVVQLGNCASLE